MRRRNKIGFSSRTFLPSMTILPEVGSIRRLTMRNRVVLPEPEVPTSRQVCPSGTPKVTASTAGLLPPGNTLVISWNAILAIKPPLRILVPFRGREETTPRAGSRFAWERLNPTGCPGDAQLGKVSGRYFLL